MKTLIYLCSILPMAIPAACSRACDCEWLCPVSEAWACVAAALLLGAAVHVLLSIGWELHLLTR
ncbi:MAG: hypothetical protein JNM79_25545 [Burkholderiales bacterium]|nr:hypothetical protein [Burkholderiales bacterium]